MMKINGSALARVMNCAGSVGLERSLPDQPDTDYAREGDAAHWCAAQIFATGEAGKPGKKASNGWATDKDMWFYAGLFVDAALSRPMADGSLNIETTAHWFATPEIEIRCKVDEWHYDASARTLYIDDFKYGWRVVEVRDNWQLIGYAVGVCRELADRQEPVPERIVLGVYQPRPWHPDGPHRTWEISLQELVSLHDRIVSRLNALDDLLQTGDHCTYCPAAPGNCPAIRIAGYNALDVTMRGGNMTLTPSGHAEELDTMTRAQELVKQRVSWLQDLATHRLKSGEIIPGYRLADVYGHSEWDSVAAVKALAKEAGVNLFERKPVTPAEAIRRGVDEDKVKEHSKRPKRGVKLAKGSSAKEAEKVFK